MLANEMVTVDGLQIVGVSNGDAGYPIRLRAVLESLHLIPAGRAFCSTTYPIACRSSSRPVSACNSPGTHTADRFSHHLVYSAHLRQVH